ncbi:sensor histidine kinase [Sphingomonas sp. PR090111-T3T-6A]|uniref:sensor histidine kinase n=1 Tax=Sphingomonas sp. PR090111-T3T-6A TaxID=685778 RepID=UPI00036BF3DD|nr:HAMP domain-containing sensor histidine kinase [Sphingomonas sp. PR090111-T3T-6A]
MVRSAAYRIAIVYSAAFAAAAMALGGGVYWAAHVALHRQLDDRIAAEMSSLISEYRGEGAASLRMVIARRENARATGDLGYALFAPDGKRVAGLLDTARPDTGWSSIAFVDPGEGDDTARALAVDLRNGERLVVAADWEEVTGTERLILSLLGFALVAMLLIGTAGALLLGAYLRRRLSAISTAAERIMAGDLHRRVAMSPRGDEFDRLSAALNAMLDRIGELLDNLRQVSSDVAHDLRTPLTRLRNQLEEGRRPDAGPEVIERAIEQSDEVLALFGALLRLSEIESGRLNETFGPVDLSRLATDIGESYAPAVEDEGRTLICRIDPAASVTGDRELIAQALINLLDNAQRHTPEGTAIRLSLRVREDRVRLEVADDGPGVAEADRGRITQRFARLEASRSRPGHGLGLSLVAAIARIHGAKLVIGDNRPGLIVALEFGR